MNKLILIDDDRPYLVKSYLYFLTYAFHFFALLAKPKKVCLWPSFFTIFFVFCSIFGRKTVRKETNRQQIRQSIYKYPFINLKMSA